MVKDFFASIIVSGICMALIVTMACNSKNEKKADEPKVNDEDVMTIAPTDATPVATVDATPVEMVPDMPAMDATTVSPSSKDATPVM